MLIQDLAIAKELSQEERAAVRGGNVNIVSAPFAGAANFNGGPSLVSTQTALSFNIAPVTGVETTNLTDTINKTVAGSAGVIQY